MEEVRTDWENVPSEAWSNAKKEDHICDHEYVEATDASKAGNLQSFAVTASEAFSWNYSLKNTIL